jgi:CBS domain-containing protein
MRLSSIGTRETATVAPTATAAEIARQMEERNVGSVLVVKEGRAVGIVTDRDLVLRVLRKGLAPAAVRAEQVMTAPAVCVADEASPEEAATRMKERRVRRLPIVARDGSLVGIVCFDDLVHHLGRTQTQMAEAISTLPRFEASA